MFQLEKLTEAACIHANVRSEMHGKTERARAIDLRWRITGENHLLDLIQPGLREHFYCNKAVEAAIAAGQKQLMPDEIIPLPNLRYPLLSTENVKWGDKAYRGYRWVWDWGTQEDYYDFTDVVVGNITIEKMEEGGTVTILFTTQYNGEELNDNEVYGELAGLPSMDGKQHIRLLAPAELVAVTKGYRANKPNTPQEQAKDPRQQELTGDGGATGDGERDSDEALREAEEDVLTPERALAGSLADQQQEGGDEQAMQDDPTSPASTDKPARTSRSKRK